MGIYPYALFKYQYKTKNIKKKLITRGYTVKDTKIYLEGLLSSP